MDLPTDVRFFAPEERDEDGYYLILPGITHVFSFTVPFLNSIKVEAAHILPNSQDWSVDVWFSDAPLDGVLFGRDASLVHFNPTRRMYGPEIFDEFLRADKDDERHFLASNRDYYVNVKNLQNRQNTYRLVFTEVLPEE